MHDGAEEKDAVVVAAPSHNFIRSAHKVNSIFVIISIIFPFGIIADNLLNDQ